MPDKINNYVKDLLATSNNVVNANSNITTLSSTDNNNKVDIVSSGELTSNSQGQANNSVLGRLYQGTKGFFGINPKPKPASTAVAENTKIQKYIVDINDILDNYENPDQQEFLTHLQNAITIDKELKENEKKKLTELVNNAIAKSNSSIDTTIQDNSEHSVTMEGITKKPLMPGGDGKKSRRRRGGMKRVKQNKSKRIHAIVTRRRKQMKKAGTKRR